MEQKEILVQMAIKAWDMQIDRTSKFIDSLDDASMMRIMAVDFSVPNCFRKNCRSRQILFIAEEKKRATG